MLLYIYIYIYVCKAHVQIAPGEKLSTEHSARHPSEAESSMSLSSYFLPLSPPSLSLYMYIYIYIHMYVYLSLSLSLALSLSLSFSLPLSLSHSPIQVLLLGWPQTPLSLFLSISRKSPHLCEPFLGA